MKIEYFFDLKNKIEKGKVENIFVVFGDEFYFFKEVEKLLKIFATREKMDYSTYYLDEIKLEEALERAMSTSLFSKKRLSILKNCHRATLNTKSKKILSEIPSGNYISFQFPCEYNFFEKLRTKKFIQFLSENFILYNLKRLKKEHAKRFVFDFLKNKGIYIDDESMELLLSRYNSDLNKIIEILEHFEIFYEKDIKKITSKNLLPFLSSYENFKITDIVDSFLDKNIKKTMIFASILRKDISEISLTTGLILWNLKKIFSILQMSKIGMDKREIQKELSLNESTFKKLLKSSYKFDIYEIEFLIREFREIDEVLKSNSKIKDIIFQKKFFQLLTHVVKY